MAPVVREPTPEQDRIRPGPLVAVAVASLITGFLVVYALGQSAAEAPPEHRSRHHGSPVGRSTPAPRPAAAPSAPVPAASPAPVPAAPPAPVLAASPAPVPAAPAAPAPAGATQGQAYYFRCWEAGHDEPVSGPCDALPVLEQRIRDRLGEIVACASGTHGTLSIGVEVQFGSRRTRWWSGRSTTITPVDPLIQCVRTRLQGTDLDGIEHRYQKYTLFVPITL
jgi:hypothetical protein